MSETRTAAPQFHGSDLEKVAEYYGIRKEDIIGFAANVNPLGLSEHLKEELAKIWTASPPIRTVITAGCVRPSAATPGRTGIISWWATVPRS